jgi:hypothetical protein
MPYIHIAFPSIPVGRGNRALQVIDELHSNQAICILTHDSLSYGLVSKLYSEPILRRETLWI